MARNYTWKERKRGLQSSDATYVKSKTAGTFQKKTAVSTVNSHVRRMLIAVPHSSIALHQRNGAEANVALTPSSIMTESGPQ